MAEVSLIVVNYYTADHLRALVESARAHSPFARYEWIVVDNSPGGESLPSIPEPCRVISPGRNLGFAAACNLAAKASQADFLFFCNPDITFLESLEPLISLHGGKYRGGVPLINPRQRFQLRRFPTPLNFFVDFCGPVTVWPGNPWSSRYYYDHHPPDRPFPVLQPAACALLVERSAYEDLSGMDEAFFPAWFEDVDFSYRYWKKGYRFLCDPRVSIAHTLGVSADRIGRQEFLKIYARNYTRFARKHFNASTKLFSMLFLRMGMALRGIGSW
ncbi:MAG TPA: glycosyltransferase [Thermoanaerobaculia bacterium]|nr:glycosyltransferase [Thermoanaerobaculia bacterium]HUM28841.1 glycosyltransferase [Thermoanaerobaculia bacterium]HXK67225.1 glycosyltransferase [Thermoanaerobaculia bacterium]